MQTEYCAEQAGKRAFSWRKNKYLLAATGAVCIWSSSFVATKFALQAFPPLGLGFLRFLLAVVFLGAGLFFCRQWQLPAWQDLRRLAAGGFFGVMGYFSLENTGLHDSSAADAALIVAAYPLMSVLLEWLLYKKQLSAAMLGGILLAAAGMVFLILLPGASSQSSGTDRLTGDLLLLLAGIVWFFYNQVTKTVVHRYPLPVVTFYQFFFGVLFFLPAIVWEDASWKEPAAAELTALLFLSLFCSLAAFFLYVYGLRGISGSTAVLLLNLVPVLGIFLSALLLGETLAGWQWLGAACILAGVLLGVRQRTD